jgi:cyclomaltodextrinase / maltogenic alpha-amylase / neopullulanase
MLRFCAFATITVLLAGCAGSQVSPPVTTYAEPPLTVEERVPDWVKDAVFYQLFPERFRNGDPSNDPTHASLEFPDITPQSWAVKPWTQDWYYRQAWEREMGPDFYEHGVFHRRLGGDLQGVLDQMDYLADLGINTIYFNPVFYARSLHKYDGNSFHHIEPHFGPDPAGDLALIAQEDPMDPETWLWTSADLLFLDVLDAAHDRGIRVVIDGVFNHTGRDFPAFADIVDNQAESRFRDWYVVHEFDDPATEENEFRYQGWWGVDTLPEFAEEGDDLHPGPKAYVMNSTQRWMQPVVDGVARRGIDGWRLDVANEVPTGFWREWNRFVRELNPEAYTVAEIWDEASDYLRDAGFSATMNYHAFAYPVKGFLIDDHIGPEAFADRLVERKERYPEAVRYAMQNLIDSHDTDRVASMIVNRGPHEGEYEAEGRFDYDWGSRVSPRFFPDYDVRRPYGDEWQIQRLLTLFQMTYVGAPMIYYGTEAGMWGADDPDDRKPMVWPDMTFEHEAHHPLGYDRPRDRVAFDADLFDYYRSTINLRKEHAPLRRGDFEVLFADDDTRTLAFRRALPADTLVVVLNRSEQDAAVVIPASNPDLYRTIFETARTGQVRTMGAGETLSVNVPALGGAVLRKAEQQ